MKRLARIVIIESDQAKLELEKWVCAKEGDQIALFRSHSRGSAKLIGWGVIFKGNIFF